MCFDSSRKRGSAQRCPSESEIAYNGDLVITLCPESGLPVQGNERSMNETHILQGSEDSATNEEYFKRLKHFFEKEIRFNAFLRMCVAELGEGYARLEIPYREELIGDPLRPALHGGVVSTLLDTAGGIAAFTSVAPGDLLSTVDLRVDYLRPAGLLDLSAEGRVVRIGNRVAVCDIVAYQDDPEKPVATGKGVYNIKRTCDQ